MLPTATPTILFTTPTATIINPWEVLHLTGYILFWFWPVVLLAGITRSKSNTLEKMIFVWGIFAIIRIGLFFSDLPPTTLFIPEPLNTIVFFATGATLIALLIGIRSIQSRTGESLSFSIMNEIPRMLGLTGAQTGILIGIGLLIIGSLTFALKIATDSLAKPR